VSFEEFEDVVDAGRTDVVERGRYLHGGTPSPTDPDAGALVLRSLSPASGRVNIAITDWL
jgi:hypothetical protein